MEQFPHKELLVVNFNISMTLLTIGIHCLFAKTEVILDEDNAK